MANTFKLKTNDNMPATDGTPLTLYTCPDILPQLSFLDYYYVIMILHKEQ